MASTAQYLQYAETALAAYALSLSTNSGNSSAFTTAGMTTAQAIRFDTEWTALAQAPDTPNGFSAVLLQNRSTGEKVLAIRGTEASQGGIDYITDIVNIAALGTVAGMAQYQALEAFYQHLVASGKLTTTEQVTVTGHSLGGFLAQAFTARHPSSVGAAYTYNAPGFGGVSAQLLEFIGITDASAVNGKIINVRATDGVSATAGLGQVLGTVQQVRIESGSANPVYYHSIATLTDTLSVYRLFADLQLSLTVDQIGRLFAAADNGDRRLEDALDTLRAVFIGSDANNGNRTPGGDREALISNLYALQDDADFVALKGRIQLVAAGAASVSAAQAATSTSLAHRYALLELLPFAVVADTEAANQTLYGAYMQRLSLYDEATGQGELTREWLVDRASMLDWLTLRNAKNISGVVTGGQTGRTIVESLHLRDITSDTQVLVGTADQMNQRRQVIFGGGAADAIDGFSRNDALYGGAGDDTLSGQGGNDRLEGNAGADTLDGGAGSDWLAGGAGDDRYEFDDGHGGDTIVDSDGQDTLWFAGQQLTGGKKVDDNYWISDDRQFGFTRVPNGSGGYDLVVTRGGRLDQIRIRNWAAGQMGLALDDAAAYQPQQRESFGGDGNDAMVGGNDDDIYVFNVAIDVASLERSRIAIGASLPQRLLPGSSRGDCEVSAWHEALPFGKAVPLGCTSRAEPCKARNSRLPAARIERCSVVNFKGLKSFVVFGLMLSSGANMNAVAATLGLRSNSWNEEVLLHDGRRTIVERSQTYGGRSEPGQSAPIKEHTIRFKVPGSGKTVVWTSEYTNDIGRANFNLLALHVLGATPYVVASPNLCAAYNKWGRPNPPYVVFKYDGKQWQRIAMDALPVDFKTINVVLSVQKFQADELTAWGTVSAEKVSELNAHVQVPEFKGILREALPKEKIVEMCGDRVLYKGHWIVPNSPTARAIVDSKQK